MCVCVCYHISSSICRKHFGNGWVPPKIIVFAARWNPLTSILSIFVQLPWSDKMPRYLHCILLLLLLYNDIGSLALLQLIFVDFLGIRESVCALRGPPWPSKVGYGDFGPRNVLERMVCIWIVLTSGLSWAYILGEVCAIVSEMTAESQRFRKKMHHLNSLMEEQGWAGWGLN